MRHKVKKKWWIAFFSLIIILGIIWISSRPRNYLLFEKVFKYVSDNVLKIVQGSNTNSKENYLDLSLSKEREKELNNLKKLLELKSILSDFSIDYASTIYRNVSYFKETITVDKGSNLEIELDSAVVTENGLIGKVEKVGYDSCEVRLLTSNYNQPQVSVVVELDDSSLYGVLSQYDNKKEVFYVTGIPATTEIPIGARVVTSGMGGIFPSGIFIGNVESASNDNYGITKKIEVKSKQDFNNLKYVAILKRNEESL